jgi:hypothetical protein
VTRYDVTPLSLSFSFSAFLFFFFFTSFFLGDQSHRQHQQQQHPMRLATLAVLAAAGSAPSLAASPPACDLLVTLPTSAMPTRCADGLGALEHPFTHGPAEVEADILVSLAAMQERLVGGGEGGCYRIGALVWGALGCLRVFW